MSKPSKRDLARQEKLEQLRKESAAADPAAAPSTASQTTPPSPPPAADASAEAVDQRARGAGVSRILANLGDGLAGKLQQAEADRDDALTRLEESRRFNEELRMRMEAASQGGEAAVQFLDPATVCFTKFHNRDPRSFTDEDRDFRAIKADIAKKRGNVIPGLVRPLNPPEGPYLYEAIYGNRRLASCRQVGVPFKAYIQSVSDDEAMLYQHVENAYRKKMSTIETGRKIRSFLDHKRNDAGRAADGALNILVETLKLEKTHIAKLSLIGSIPDEVLETIPDVRDIPYRPALQLARVCRDSLDDVLGRIASIDESWPSRKVANHLIGTSGTTRPLPSGGYRIVLPDDEDTRIALKREFAALEEKYGIKLHLAPEDSGA